MVRRRSSNVCGSLTRRPSSRSSTSWEMLSKYLRMSHLSAQHGPVKLPLTLRANVSILRTAACVPFPIRQE